MRFDLQPVLEGSLVALRPLGLEDFDQLYAVASDPKIWEQHPAPDRYKIDVFQGFFREAIKCGGALIATDRKDGQVIGSSRFDNLVDDLDGAAGEVEIGWTFLARSHWGGDYNREMKHLMLTHAFKFVDRVVFLVGPDNLRSQKAMEKIGGRPAGWRRNKNGLDTLMYEITASAYRESPLLPRRV